MICLWVGKLLLCIIVAFHCLFFACRYFNCFEKIILHFYCSCITRSFAEVYLYRILDFCSNYSTGSLSVDEVPLSFIGSSKEHCEKCGLPVRRSGSRMFAFTNDSRFLYLFHGTSGSPHLVNFDAKIIQPCGVFFLSRFPIFGCFI